MKKLIVILLAFAMLLCAVACGVPSEDGNDTVIKSPYDDIIKKYKELLTERTNGELPDPTGDNSDEIGTAVYEIVRDCVDPAVMGYATKDINGDGSDELILMDQSNKLYALFTVQTNTPVLLLKLDSMSAAITPDGTLYASRYEPNKGESTHIKRIVDGRLTGLEYGGVIEGETVTCYKIENGVRSEITMSEKLQLDAVAQSIFQNARYQTKTTGFRFVSAAADTSENAAPTPDFTSYDGILSAYKIIVESFSEYSRSSWINGEFDGLFAISDNESYGIFHQIFYGGIRVKPTETYFGQDYAKDGDNAYGYAKKDLNGDGSEELILLTDNFEIFAIFTMVNGKAVMLDGAYGAWIDKDGRIRKDVATGGLVSRDAEVFVYEIDGAEMKPVIGVGYKVNFYLEKEGWYKIDGDTRVEISKEEGEALYAEYDILPPGYCNEEYTRTFSGIVFSPLFDASLVSQKHVNTYSNVWFVNGNTLTVSAVSDSSVTFEIKIIYTDREFDPETNPDPEVYITNIAGEALRNKNRYEFEKDGVKGYIEFAVNSAWVIVTESADEHVECRAYLFNCPEN